MATRKVRGLMFTVAESSYGPTCFLFSRAAGHRSSGPFTEAASGTGRVYPNNYPATRLMSEASSGSAVLCPLTRKSPFERGLAPSVAQLPS